MRIPGKDLLVLRLLLALLIVFNLGSGGLSDFLVNHLPFIVALIVFPDVLKFWGVELTKKQILWISIGLIIHPVGAIYGLYANTCCYDILAHTYNSTIVSSIILVYLWRKDYSEGEVILSSLAGIALAGLAWEVFERIADPLTVYGFWDTVGDLFFNKVGWAIALVFGKDRLENVWRPSPEQDS